MQPCQIDPAVKDFQIAKNMFGEISFTSSKQQSKILCQIVKKLRRKPIESVALLGDAAIIQVDEDLWYIGSEYLTIGE